MSTAQREHEAETTTPEGRGATGTGHGLTSTRIVGAAALPRELREYGGLDRIDFADRVSVGGAPRRTAEQWARLILGDTPNPPEVLIWQRVLGVRLDRRRTADTVAGWRVVRREERRILLAAPSPIVTGQIIVTADDDRVTLTSCLRFDTPRGRAAWLTVRPLHALVVPLLVLAAARKDVESAPHRPADLDRSHDEGGEHVVVLGAGYAGLLAARSLARHLPGSARLTLVNDRDRFVERMRLHQLVTGQPPSRITLEESMRGTGAQVVVGAVGSLDRAGRAVVLEDGRRIGYDRLVYAVGSRSLPAPHGATGLADPLSAEVVRRRLDELREGSVTVVGGGLTGIEAATEIAERRADLDVRLLSRAPVDAGMTARAGRRLRASLSRLGVTLREGVRVSADSAGGLHAVDADGVEEPIAADLVIWSTGFSAPALAEDAGLSVDRQRRVIVDDRLRSIDDERIYAIGDAGVIDGPDGLARMSCQTAVPMASWLGRRLGGNVAGKPMPPHRPRFVWRNISLGRNDGITQFTHWDDRPLPFFLHGRAAAGFKELVNGIVARQVTGRRPGVDDAR